MSMSNETGISIYEPKNREDAIWAAETISKSGLAPAGLDTPQKILVAMMHGSSLGLGAMSAIQNIHVIKNKPTLSADLMGALVRQSAACLYLREIEATTERVTFTSARSDDPDHEFSRSWTMEDARRAGLGNSQTWKAYPRQMLRARCQSEICRAVFPEVVGGFYDPSEISDDTHARPAPPRTIGAAASHTIPKANAVIDVVPILDVAPGPEPDPWFPFACELLDRVEILQSAGVRHADSAADKILSVGRAGGTEDEQRESLAKITEWANNAEAATVDE